MKIEIDMSGIFNKFIWFVIAGAVTFSAKKVNDMSNSIASLNEKVAIVMIWQSDKTGALKDHEARLRELEGKKTHAPF